MADEIAPVEQPVVVEAPVVAAPAPEPAVVVEAAPAPAPVVEQPVVAPEAPVEAAPAEAPAPRPDLLKDATAEEGEPAKEPVAEKPAEPPAEKVEAAPDAPEAEPPPPVETPRLEPLAEYKYEIPEGLQFSDEQKPAFHSAVEDARNGNLQPLVAMHHEALSKYDQAASQRQVEAWHNTLNEWKTQTENDPDIGGRNLAGVQRRVAQMRDNYVSRHERGSEGWKADMADFNHMLDSTGAGNHRALWRLLDNMTRALNEGRSPTIVDPKPVPQGKRGASALYTNDRSPGNGRA
jgi:hypothetical protein